MNNKDTAPAGSTPDKAKRKTIQPTGVIASPGKVSFVYLEPDSSEEAQALNKGIATVVKIVGADPGDTLGILQEYSEKAKQTDSSKYLELIREILTERYSDRQSKITNKKVNSLLPKDGARHSFLQTFVGDPTEVADLFMIAYYNAFFEADRRKREKLAKEAEEARERAKKAEETAKKLKEENEALRESSKSTLPIRMGRQLIDNSLDIEQTQPDLWGDDIRDILSSNAEATLFKGLPLTSVEWRLIYIFYKFLNESNGFNNNPETAFLGDSPAPKRNGGVAPGLVLTYYQIAKEYYGPNPSGESIKNIKQALERFKDRKFLFTYTADTKSSEYVIQEYGELFTFGVIRKKDKETGKKEGVEYIRLHPLFRSGISDKYVLWPPNILDILEGAYGKKQISTEVFNLLAHVTREQSSKRYTIVIGKDRLYKMVSPINMAKSRKKDAKLNTLTAIETLGRLGVIVSVEEKPAKNGKLSYHIKTVNPWIKGKDKPLPE
jgi:hypothetical protein